MSGNQVSRRAFLRNSSIAAAGLLAGGHVLRGSNVMANSLAPATSRVAFKTGTDRRQMIVEVLEPLKQDIITGIKNKQIIIKPNLVMTDNVLANTPIDAIRGLLDFLKPLTDQQIIIGESSALSQTSVAFENLGYTDLPNEYNVKLVDLNTQPSTEMEIKKDLEGGTSSIQVSDTFLDPDNYIISICRPKSHNYVVATLTVKNILMGSPIAAASYPNSDKAKMHGDPDNAEVLTNNMFLMADKCLPQLSIIDGYEGMEGNGPASGTAVQHRVAVASTDPIAADAVGVKLMGINPDLLPYLKWCSNAGYGNYDLSKITIVGPDTDLDSHIMQYALADNISDRLSWFNAAAKKPNFFNPMPVLSMHTSGSSMSGSGIMLEFSLPVGFSITLGIFDYLGRELRTLASEYLPAGKYSIRWDGKDAKGSTIGAKNYIARLRAGHHTVSGKITLGR